jgi:hypothetical protein
MRQATIFTLPLFEEVGYPSRMAADNSTLMEDSTFEKFFATVTLATVCINYKLHLNTSLVSIRNPWKIDEEKSVRQN